MKLNTIVLFYLFTYIKSLKYEIVKNLTNRKLFDKSKIILTNNKIFCLKKKWSNKLLKNCLNKLNISNFQDARNLIQAICLNDIKKIKSNVEGKKLSNFFVSFENFFNNDTVTLKKYNNLLLNYQSQLKKNKLILNGLNKIKNYLNKIIIIKDVFTEENLKKFESIRQDFSKDLANTQKKNELIVKIQKEKLNKIINKSKTQEIKDNSIKEDQNYKVSNPKKIKIKIKHYLKNNKYKINKSNEHEDPTEKKKIKIEHIIKNGEVKTKKKIIITKTVDNSQKIKSKENPKKPSSTGIFLSIKILIFMLFFAN